MKWIITAGSVLAVITACLTFWGTYGWITRSAYAIDEQKEHAIHQDQASKSDISALITEIRTARQEQKLYHDEWKCDEADESVIDLRMAMAEESNQRRMIVLTDDLKKIEEVRVDLNCSQFTD